MGATASAAGGGKSTGTGRYSSLLGERDSVQFRLQAAEEREELPGDLRQAMMGELILNPPDQPLCARVVAWYLTVLTAQISDGYWPYSRVLA
jgi:hypothetical protein